jgi:hypothetical protein
MEYVHGELPAFPKPQGGNNGITIREYIATSVLQGLLAGNTSGALPQTVELAVQYADELIRQLTKPTH